VRRYRLSPQRRRAVSTRWIAGDHRLDRDVVTMHAPVASNPAAEGTIQDLRVVESLLVGLVPTVLGLVAYAIVREGYVWMYERYGLSPEDVGMATTSA
jgi:hypothetical protein